MNVVNAQMMFFSDSNQLQVASLPNNHQSAWVSLRISPLRVHARLVLRYNVNIHLRDPKGRGGGRVHLCAARVTRQAG